MPPALLYTLGVVIFALGLLLSIALHEIGHMVPAKKFGVKVTQFFVGFGPTAWSKKVGETEYGVKAIPVGGYIRMIGMVPPRADGKVSRWPRRLASAIEEFRQVSRAEVDPQDENRQFYRLTPGKKMIVMLGGPCMNLLIFLVLTVVLLTTLGIGHNDPTTTVQDISKCVVAADSPAANLNKCPKDAPAAPAFGKLKPGDRITAVDGQTVHTWQQIVNRIEPAAGTTLTLTVVRNGQTRDIPVTPVENVKYANATGTETKRAGFLGVSSHLNHYYEALPVTAVPGQIGDQLSAGLDALGRYPEKVASLWRTVFDGQKRDPQGAVGVVGIGRISGDFAKSDLLTVQDKVETLIGLLASVNLLLFLFNLLPLLPLDGGHVAGAIVEAVKRGRARLRARRAGQPDARPQIFVDTAQMVPVMYAVASVLIVLTLLTLYADIVKPINVLSG